MEPLTSPRLLLRPYALSDAASYFAMWHDNRDHLDDFMPAVIRGISSVAAMEAHFGWLAEEASARRLLVFGSWDRGTGGYVGEGYFANPDWDVPCIELGYFLVAASTGAGFATEIARRLTAYAFLDLRVERVELEIAATNHASAAVAERCGFTLEGRLRNRKRLRDGAIVDRLWYGLLRDDWRA